MVVCLFMLFSFYIFLFLFLLPMVYTVFIICLFLNVFFNEYRELEIKAAGQWFLLFFGESLCSLLMILVITNALTSWETQVRSSWITTTILNHSANSSANNSSSTTTNNNNSTTNNSSTTTNTTKSAIMMMATEQTRILPSTAAAYSAAANKAQYQAIPQQEK